MMRKTLLSSGLIRLFLLAVLLKLGTAGAQTPPAVFPVSAVSTVALDSNYAARFGGIFLALYRSRTNSDFADAQLVNLSNNLWTSPQADPLAKKPPWNSISPILNTKTSLDYPIFLLDEHAYDATTSEHADPAASPKSPRQAELRKLATAKANLSALADREKPYLIVSIFISSKAESHQVYQIFSLTKADPIYLSTIAELNKSRRFWTQGFDATALTKILNEAVLQAAHHPQVLALMPTANTAANPLPAQPEPRLGIESPLPPLNSTSAGLVGSEQNEGVAPSFYNSRSRPMHVALGFLGAGLAVSAAGLAILAGLNWGGSDVATLSLGNTCGPQMNLSCGVVKQELTSGVWIAFGATVTFGIGLAAATIADYSDYKIRRKLPPMQPLPESNEPLASRRSE